MNNLTLLARLCRDPELRFTASNTQVCQLSLAYNDSYTKSDGTRQETAYFFDAVAFGKTAEAINKYFHKGEQILIRGSISQDKWTDKESGQDRSKVKIRVAEFSFVGSKQDSQGQSQRPPGRNPAGSGGHVPVDESDIPFAPNAFDGSIGCR